ncbi:MULTISPECIES: hypothetical protein [unclassified Lactococcus]|uniref:hypothetical protein n=1 Tax=unclassified Lactococcus TaxID=2643510 RepID=UPI0011CAF6BC|nr:MULTISPECIES: hypothetical protein [unclassified Lactococcus]MQW23902.1 hypothetical protein [Lactococcus sp. dk101]TXK37130.1 hypothetical protein FVP42_09780 [Lactococcus sp. dk310]TXK47984.1 hypothetical protein FVP43_09505 [Lactococcus sp. dk322]
MKSKYDEDLKKACEVLNNAQLDELLKIAVEAMDDAAIDIGMEANQEWHAKITLESALIHIAEKLPKYTRLTIPKKVAEELDELIEIAHASNEIHVWSDNFDYYKFINNAISEEDDLYKYMYPKDQLIGTLHRNTIIRYLIDNDLVEVVDE